MISVVMITRNEEGAVRTVIEDIQREVPEAEILLVDSSEDNTAEIAAELGARVIKQHPPKGYGPAMDLALKSASGEIIVTLDCDNTYPVEQIRRLAHFIDAEGFDVVDASRLEHKPAAMPWINYFANAGFALLASMLFRQRITDLHSGMRAYHRAVIHSLAWQPNGPALPVELLLRPIARGKRVKMVFIDYHERVGQSKMDPLRSAWWTLKRILACRFDRSPHQQA